MACTTNNGTIQGISNLKQPIRETQFFNKKLSMNETTRIYNLFIRKHFSLKKYNFYAHLK